MPDGRLGRPVRFSTQAIEFCLTLKGRFQLPLRQVSGLVQSLLRMAGLDWLAPDYTTLCRRQKSLSVDLGRRSSSGGLPLLVDSTGIKIWVTWAAQPCRGHGEQHKEWKTRKHGASYRRQWRKVHIVIDAETFDILALEMTTNANGDGQTLPDLLRQIPEDETILSEVAMVPMTQGTVTPPLPGAGLSRLSRFAATASHGPRTARASMPAMKRYER